MIEIKIQMYLAKTIPMFNVDSVHWIHEMHNLNQAKDYAEKMMITYARFEPTHYEITVLSEKPVQLPLF